MRIALVAVAALGLAGCAGQDYPSLAHRPAEEIAAASASVIPPIVTTFDVAPAPAALRERLDQLVAQARTGHAAFTARRAKADATVAAAAHAAVASEEWSVATVALSDLQSARSDTASAFAELERLYSEDRVGHAIVDANAAAAAPRPSGTAIAAARDEVAAMVAEEDAVIAALEARLAS